LSTLNTLNSIEGSLVQSSSKALPPPPRYLEKHPKTQVTYTFTPQTNPANSMIMSPPSYLDDYPSYYISVNMNCFTPFSYITTVRRDGWDGEIVGDFEMGIPGSRKLGTVCLHGNECPIDEILESNPKVFRGGSYLWKSKGDLGPSTVNLHWEESSAASSSILSCFLGKEKMVTNDLARFMPSTVLRRPGRTTDFTRLDVTPQGHDYLDEIVMSVLIIERIRTSPSALKDLPASVLKEIF